jgi:bifunctional ADP-heptose synthase (sugar kinase/adenylyltransferase)/phosphoglycolate phosphatase-like HAD superfamily hydrolase
MTTARLHEILARLPSVAVGVIGDFCLDAYWTLDLSRSECSVETGKPTQTVRDQRYTLGGAGNVVANLRSLGVGRVAAFGVVGRDPFGSCLRDRLAAAGADASGVLAASDADAAAWQTLVYCKPHAGGEELPRIDLGAFNVLPDGLAGELVARLEAALPTLDVVVVNEQVESGIHVPRLRRRLRELMRAHPERVFLFDGRHGLDSYPEAWLKLNASEACRLAGRPPAGEPVPRAETLAAARALHARSGRPVFVTRGDRGALAADGRGIAEIPGLHILGRTDPVGAGDSFLAGAAAAAAAGASPEEAATLGNFAAGVTVQKLLQTGTATPAEVLAIGASPDCVYNPERADEPPPAGAPIEVVTAVPEGLRATCALFDHDGTISTLRQGWEEVMAPVMVRAILGPRFETAGEDLRQAVDARVRAFIDETTGIQTLAQMDGLVGLVREFGCAPEAQILDAAGYKRVYNDALMAGVRGRIAGLGAAGPEACTIRGAVAFLHRLHAAGVRLYLASGTDREDVVNEARLLGYAGLFEGRICGAEPGVREEAKKAVIGRILSELGAAGVRGLVTFGDGPVEIRETRKAGGLAVGVASDEVNREGLNPSKRRRVIRAGADLVIPDFSVAPQLLPLLGIAD